MSSSNYHYLGCYFSVPKNIEWYDLVEDLDIVDEFNYISELNICISNYAEGIDAINDNEEYQAIELKNANIEKLKLKFEKKHNAHLEILKKHFKKSMVIKFGLISYCM